MRSARTAVDKKKATGIMIKVDEKAKEKSERKKKKVEKKKKKK